MELPIKKIQQLREHRPRPWGYVALLGIIGVLAFVFLQLPTIGNPREGTKSDSSAAEYVIPSQGIVLPIEWRDLGAQMVSLGVIDPERFEELYVNQGGLGDQEKALLYGSDTDEVRMTPENAPVLLNLFWAFGLANENIILEEGPMQDEAYGGAQNFASTGGWTLAKGDAMEHYSAYNLVTLTSEQQELVERVAKNIYRPCCGNSTYFPDCNHGLAMLGLLQLLAVEGVTEDEMYRIALRVNAYWFPDTYLTIAKLFEKRGLDWNDVDPKTVLGAEYSSASGFSRVLSEVEPQYYGGAGSCSV